MPISVDVWRARAGYFDKNNNIRIINITNKYSRNLTNAFLFPSMFILSILIYFFSVVSLTSCMVLPRKSNVGKFKLSIFMLHCFIIHFWLKLILSGDIEINPGPNISLLNGKINFGFWNLNSILAREGSKMNQIEALQSCNNFWNM